MESFKEFIKPELLVLVVVIYFVGVWLRQSNIKNEYIPLILVCVSIFLCTLWIIATSQFMTYQDIVLAIFTAIVQGILIAGCSVLYNETIKQHNKLDSTK